MVKLEDLEVGKKYLMVRVDTTFDPYLFTYSKIIITNKGKHIPYSFNKPLADTIHDYVCYRRVNVDGDDATMITTYNEDYINYQFFNLDDDLKKEMDEILNDLQNKELAKLDKKFQQERQDIIDKLVDYNLRIQGMIEDEKDHKVEEKRGKDKKKRKK